MGAFWEEDISFPSNPISNLSFSDEPYYWWAWEEAGCKGGFGSAGVTMGHRSMFFRDSIGRWDSKGQFQREPQGGSELSCLGEAMDLTYMWTPLQVNISHVCGWSLWGPWGQGHWGVDEVLLAPEAERVKAGQGSDQVFHLMCSETKYLWYSNNQILDSIEK